MKPNIHPKYYVTEVSCGCGAAFVTRSTRQKIKVEICSECHPFYTGHGTRKGEGPRLDSVGKDAI
ncbi:50S ribosomal protein L31, partial [Planctomycetota bacterium]